MEFGLSLLPDTGPQERSGQEYYANLLEVCRQADRLGYEYVKMTEHYLRPYGVPGAHAFFAGATLSPGTHTACAVAVSPRTGLRTTIGCQTFTIRG